MSSWVVLYDGKTIPRWRTAAILKIDISPFLSEKWSDFYEILYTAADFELDERHVIKNKKKSCIGQTPSSTERISCLLRQLRTCYTPCQRGYDFERPQMKNRTFQGNLFQQVFFNILNSTVLVTSRHVFWCFSCKYMPLSCVYGRWWGWRRWWWWSKTISN